MLNQEFTWARDSEDGGLKVDDGEEVGARAHSESLEAPSEARDGESLEEWYYFWFRVRWPRNW